MASFPDSYFKLIKRLFPVNAQSSVVGVDVCPSSCKAVEVLCKGGKFELARWVVEPVAEPDEKSTAAALGKVASALGLQSKARPVVAAVGGKGTLVRYVDMPRMSQQDMRKAFAIEADKYFPFPKDTVYTDCYILDPVDNNRKMSVLVTAAKKELVEGRMKLLKDAGMEPSDVSLNSVAVANAFAALAPSGFTSGAGAREYKACAVVDIGESGTNLMIVFAGFPRFNRDIFIGTQEICKRVANLIGVTPAEARILLAPEAKPQESVSKGVEAVLMNLIAEIRLSFDYFVTEKNLAITQIFLTGDGACIPGVERMFRENIDMPVALWDPFAGITVGAAVSREGLKANSARLVTALGLALNEYDQG